MEHEKVVSEMASKAIAKDKELLAMVDEAKRKDGIIETLELELDKTKTRLEEKLLDEQKKKEEFEGLNQHVYILLKNTNTLRSYYANSRDLEHSTMHMSRLLEACFGVDKMTTKQLLRVIEKQKQWEKEAMSDLLRDIRVRIVQAETDFGYEREINKNELGLISQNLQRRMHKSVAKLAQDESKAERAVSRRKDLEKELFVFDNKIEQVGFGLGARCVEIYRHALVSASESSLTPRSSTRSFIIY